MKDKYAEHRKLNRKTYILVDRGNICAELCSEIPMADGKLDFSEENLIYLGDETSVCMDKKRKVAKTKKIKQSLNAQ